MIDFNNSIAKKFYLADRRHNSTSAATLRVVAITVSTLFLLYWFATLIGIVPSIAIIKIVGYLALSWSIYIGMDELHFHLATKKIKPKMPFLDAVSRDDWIESVNLANYLTPEISGILGKSFNQNGQADLRLFIENLFGNKKAAILLARAGLQEQSLDPESAKIKGSSVDHLINSVDSLVIHSAVAAAENGSDEIDITHILIALKNHHQGFVDVLFRSGATGEDLDLAISWYEKLQKSQRKGFFWERNQHAGWGIGRDWASGYTPTLSDYSMDLSQFARESSLHSQVIGREDVISQIEVSLTSGSSSNVILVGKPGIGKKTIVNGLAAKIISGNVSDALKDKHIMQLNVQRLLSGETERGAIEEKMLKIFNDAAWAGNIILFVDNIHTLLGYGEGRIGSIDATEIISPFLSGNKLQIIGATTAEDFHANIEPKSVIAGGMTRVNIEEVSADDAIMILGNVALYLESRHKVFIGFPVIRDAVNLAKRYLSQVPLPESAVRILETAAVAASYRKDNKNVTKDDIADAVSKTTRVPVGEIQETEREKLMNLEEVLAERVIGQNEALVAVASALKRARSGLSSKSRPVGSFLFLGPTGVGKTETAKALSQTYFGSDNNMIRIDMSEYQTPDSVYRLIGAPTGENEGGGQLVSAIKDNPFNLILLDEIEKAHPNVLDIFLQILDDGALINPQGEKVDFTNAIIIATSNAGAVEIQEGVQAGKNTDEFKSTLLDNLMKSGAFKPEFINRFDGVIVYKPLSMEGLGKIVELQINALNKRIKDKGITVALTDAAKELVVRLGYQPEFGARPLRRVMQDKVENLVANKLLSGQVGAGDKLILDASDLEN